MSELNPNYIWWGLAGLIVLTFIIWNNKPDLNWMRRTNVRNQEPDETATPQPSPTPAAKKADAGKDDEGYIDVNISGWWIAFALLLIIGGGLWYSNSGERAKEAVRQPASTVAATIPQQPNYHFEPEELSADVALPIICGCESNNCVSPGKQFKEGTDIPLPNQEGSDAIGMCQIRTSVHEKKAAGMGFDIKTEEGNWGYAKWLYNNDHGTKHWETDPKGKWHDKLLTVAIAMGIRPTSGEPVLAVIEVEDGKWSGPKIIPTVEPGTVLHIESVDDKPYHVKINEDDKLIFSSDQPLPRRKDGVITKTLSFLGDGDKLKIRLYFSKV